MVLLRHLVVQVEQHRVDGVQGVSRTRTRTRTSGRPAEIQGVHREAEMWTDRCNGMDCARIEKYIYIYLKLYMKKNYEEEKARLMIN